MWHLLPRGDVKAQHTRAAVSSPASGSRRPASSVLEETPSPAKRARGAAARGGAAASPAKALPGPVSDVDFQDFKQKCAPLLVLVYTC